MHCIHISIYILFVHMDLFILLVGYTVHITFVIIVITIFIRQQREIVTFFLYLVRKNLISRPTRGREEYDCNYCRVRKPGWKCSRRVSSTHADPDGCIPSSQRCRRVVGDKARNSLPTVVVEPSFTPAIRTERSIGHWRWWREW